MIFQTSPRVTRGVCDSLRRLKFKLFYSPLFFSAWLRMAIAAVIGHPLWRCIFFPLYVLKRCSPLYFEPKPNLSKTLEGLLMRLVIFVNTIFQLNSLNITVPVCYVSGSKVDRKERSRPSLFGCFLFHLAKYINLGAFGSVVSVSCLESETGPARKSVRISMITGITTTPPIKVAVPLLGHYFILGNSRLFFFFFVIMWDE